MLTLDDIWMRLTTDDIGFFPYRRRDKIPAAPGVYAWFLPLRFGANPQELLSSYRKVATYDSKCLDAAKWTAEDAGFRWDPLTVELTRSSRVQLSEGGQRDWHAISAASTSTKEKFRQALFVSTIFSRPLYVGLTNNLARRYGEHVVGVNGRNNFHSRFTNYMKQIGEAVSVEQLLFACVPIRKANEEEVDMSEEQINLLEDMLKIICQPVFDDR